LKYETLKLKNYVNKSLDVLRELLQAITESAVEQTNLLALNAAIEATKGINSTVKRNPCSAIEELPTLAKSLADVAQELKIEVSKFKF